MVSNEKLAPFSELYSASAAAIFIGCCCVIKRAWLSPMNMVARVESSRTTTPMAAALAKAEVSFFFLRCQAAMPRRKVAPVARAAVRTWR